MWLLLSRVGSQSWKIKEDVRTLKTPGGLRREPRFPSWGPLLGKYSDMEPKKVYPKGKRKAESRYNLAKVTSGAEGRVRIRTRVPGVCARVAKSGGGTGLWGASSHWGC